MQFSRELQRKVLVCLSAAACVMAFSTPVCLADLSATTFGDYVVGDDLNISATPLTVGAGLVGNSDWGTAATSLSWVIAPNAEETLWHYEYTFTVPKKALSHFILQVSGNFDENSITNASDTWELGTYNASSQGNSNPNMPGELYAIKFQELGEGTTPLDADTPVTWVISFDSPHDPVWSHFYAVDGKDPKPLVDGDDTPYVYNVAFGSGSLEGYHVAAPDTTVIPVPPAVLLGMIGRSVAGVKLRKRA